MQTKLTAAEKLAQMRAKVVALENRIKKSEAQDQKRIKDLVAGFVLGRGDLSKLELGGVRFLDSLANEAEKLLVDRFMKKPRKA